MRLIIVVLLVTSLSVAAQSLPDSMVVIKNTYVSNFIDGDNLFRTERFSMLHKQNSYNLNGNRISKKKILGLFSSIKDTNNKCNSLSKYQIDTTWIKSHPNELLHFYSDKKRFQWNEQQKQFIFREFTDLRNYTESFNAYLSFGCCYTMHNSYKNEYIVRFFSNGKVIDEIKSRKFVWGYSMPWTNKSGDTLFNYDIETTLRKILRTKTKKDQHLKGKKLLGYLVNQIIDKNQRTLYALSAHSYLNEIEELKSDFKILSFDEVQERGRYIWNEPATIRVRLRNKYMLENVNLVFLASKTGKTIYSRDSLKRDYRKYIDRVQSIKFITKYLKSHPDTRLDIYYFNNKGINDYNIESVNKNPKDWKLHDDYLKSLATSEKLGLKFSFDVDQAIKTSQNVHCGCNYRFDPNYFQQAIFFEIRDYAGNNSIWFLLPDEKVLLYIMDGLTTLNLKRSYFNEPKGYGLIYPCALFDINGNRVTELK